MTPQPPADPPAPAEAPPLAWGVLGAARIGRKVVPALRAAGDRVVAIGASTAERARAYAAEFEIDAAHEGYQAVIEAPEVDAVYIPLTNDQHFRWALACARAGKPCLCEKPLVMTAEEARQLREAFAQAGTRLVEAFMWRHHPQTRWIVGQLSEGELGDLQRLHAEFSFALDRPEDHRWSDAHGGGSLWDVGVYCVNAARLVFNDEPIAVAARKELVEGAREADRSAAGWLDFGHGRLATFHCSFVTAFHQRMVLTGTSGMLEVERPFIGALNHPTACRSVQDERIQETTFAPDNSFVHQCHHFRRAVADPSFALMPAEDGLAQARVMEALVASARSGGDVQRLRQE